MLNYDFRTLQFNEFESLSRDLLQKKYSITIECFTEGRDNGIDLRFALTKDKNAVVQVKRYENFSELYSKLKKEVTKVKNLSPERYYLITSVGLTPANKDNIMRLFDSYIKSTDDILGKDDLNNLLGLYPDLEKKYYKLWLASTEVLNGIINKEIINWSTFELDTIREEVTKYVSNDSFIEAYNILNEYKYVIISGIPGIGKTTLARMIVYNLLAKGYEEFICIEENLDEASKLFQKGKKQVFFFDDFLGSNVFEPGEKRFDRKLITFIKGIQREKDKMFIMTTREYLLSEAMLQYEIFQSQNIEIAKCTVNLGHYTKYIRAKILYNHLVDANLPNEYINELISNKSYDKILDHTNFNPRIIETYIDKGMWKSYKSNDFMNKFIDFFDKPMMVWQQAFEKLDENARYSLLVFSTMGKYVYLQDWYKAYMYFCYHTNTQLGLNCDEQKWNHTLKVLQDCFIKIEKRDKIMIVDYFNPSVQDFISSYLMDYNETVKLLINNSYYTDQLYTLFGDSQQFAFIPESKVIINKELYETVVSTFHKLFAKPEVCTFSYFKGLKFKNRTYNEVDFCLNMLNSYPIICKRNDGFIEKSIEADVLTWQTIPFIKRTDLMTKMDWNETPYDFKPILESLTEEPKDTSEYLELIKLYEHLGQEKMKDNESFQKDLEEQVYNEIKNLESEEDGDSLKDIIEDIDSRMNCLSYAIIKELDRKIMEIIGPEVDTEDDSTPLHHTETGDDSSIYEMFTSLYTKN
jgi:hypothetical protein